MEENEGMLRETGVHALGWCEKTMSMMRERQLEACEKRLSRCARVGLFSPDATDADAQRLFDTSFYAGEERLSRLPTIAWLRERVLKLLPREAALLSTGERTLLERLLISDAGVELTEMDEAGPAEALVSRLWCFMRLEGERVFLCLPEALSAPLLVRFHEDDSAALRERVFRFEATMRGLLYIAGFLHAGQPTELFMSEVAAANDRDAARLARRTLQASFEYTRDEAGDMILLHPGLAEPQRMVLGATGDGVFTLSLTQEMLLGGMNGLLPEEAALHEAMCGALQMALRPEFDVEEAADDLRMLAKQGVSIHEMEEVLSAMLTTLPTPAMRQSLRMLCACTPRWIGLSATVKH